MICIIGKTASGKTSIVNKLVKLHNMKQIITYTSRPMRKNEKQDVTYHYISEYEFKQKILEGFFAEWKTYNTEFGVWYYGTALEDIEAADDNSVIILTPAGYKDVIKRISKNKMTSIYIHADDSTILKRLKSRGDNEDEAVRRLNSDNIDFEGIENEVDCIIHNDVGTDINNVVNKIMRIYHNHKHREGKI